jgi:hypothetical protein
VHWSEHPIFSRHVAGDPDRYLYRYTSLEQAAAVALRKSLLLAPLWAMNDVNESEPQLINPVTSTDDPSDPVRSVPEAVWRPVQDELDRRRLNTRIVAFTRDSFAGADTTAKRADARGFARQTMWAHYADDCQGVCLVYDRQKLIDAAEAKWNHAVACRDVTYTEAGFSSAIARRGIVSFDTPPNIDDHYRRMVIPNLFEKNGDWAVEREFRVLIPDDANLDASLNVDGKVVGIVLGPRFKEFALPTALAIARAFDVPYRNIAHVRNIYGVLEPGPIRRDDDGSWGLYDALGFLNADYDAVENSEARLAEDWNR